MIRKATNFITIAVTCYILCVSSAFSMERVARLGVGFSNQFANETPAISFKLQQSKSFAIGGMLAINTNEFSGGNGAGLKMYNIIFDEPQLNFYFSFLGALINRKTTTKTESGFQFDFTFGSEFSFSGLDSLGASIEFGASLNKLNDFQIQTVGHNFITAGIHFYL